jgi:uncharacterized membrane protein (DUF106 family)
MYSYFLTVLIPALPINVALAVIFFGIGYGTLTLTLQRRLSNPAKTKEMQVKINALTKEMNAMAKRNEDISAKQAELMPLISESMRSQMKSMFVILPIFFIIYYLILPAIFGGFAAEYFTLLVPLSTQSLFIITAIMFSLFLTLSIFLRDKMVTKRLKNLQTSETANNPQDTKSPPDTNNVK